MASDPKVVAALLPDDMVRGVLDGDLRGVDGFEWMQERGIVNEHCELTDFGDEIARVLRETTDGE